MADDLISRQVAIDAMENVDWYHINKDGRLIQGANSEEDEPLYKAEDIYNVLEQLPSAEPEIIRCKDCEYWSEYEYINGKLELFPWCELNMTFSKEDDFCSHAERRSDE